MFYILSIVFILFVAFKFKSKHFAIFLFLFSFLIRLIAIILVKTPIESDFASMYNASRELLEGKNNYINTPYFQTWGYQTGHVFYQYLLLKICDSTTFLKVINCLLHSGIVVLIYSISKEFTNERCARIVSLIYSIFLFPLLLNTVLSNQQMAAFAMVLGIYIFISKKFDNMNSLLRNIIVGLLFVVSNVCRSEMIVIIFSILLFSILILKKSNWKKVVKNFLVIIATYLIVFNLISHLFIVNNISKNGLKNMNPSWKFVVGLNKNTNGKYNSSDDSKYSGFKNVDEAKKEAINRMLDIPSIPKLFLNKSKIFWTESNLYWSTHFLRDSYVTIMGKEVEYNKIDDMAINFNRYTIWTILILFLIGLFFNIKNCKNNALLLYIIILVYYGVYLLIEIMPRYAYTPQIFMSILSAFGVEIILEKYKIIKEAFDKSKKERIAE